MENDNIDLSSLRISHEKKDQPPIRPIPWKIITPVLVLIVLAGVVFALRTTFRTVPEVELTTVTMTSASQSNSVLTASGYVVAQVKAAVASKATGRLERLFVEEGDRVRRNQIIGQLDDRDLVAGLDQARANLAVARADSNDASRTLSRQQTLFAAGLTSRAELDAAEARYQRVIAMISSSEASVNAAEVAFENTRIRAPFDGTVLTKNADVGEMVAPFGAATNSKGAVVTMADMSSLQVEADVSESNITRVSAGQSCEIILDAYPDRRYAGSVYKIVPTADRAKATVLTKVAFRELDDRVLPEMSAKVNFLTQAMDGATGSAQKLTVPAGALLERNGKRFAFTVRDGVLEEVEVKIGSSSGPRIEILEGLVQGSRVVLNPVAAFSTGTSVKVKQ
jgi:RND family efflux transporter MFP subunit